MMKRLIFLCLLVTGPVLGLSQVQISGYVLDALTGERLIGANVFDILSKRGTSTNAFGYFNISVDSNTSKTLCFSFVGYEKADLAITLFTDTVVSVYLTPGRNIEQVDVEYNRRNELAEMNSTTLSMKTVKMLPSLGGEHDLIKALQLLPGVQSGSEASNGLYIRGGGPDQNLVMIDDVPLYYVNHLGGFISIFNADAIHHVKLIKGSYPARFGSRLSSVVDVRLKEGNMRQTSFSGSIGMVTMKAMLEGPVKRDTSSYLIAVRRFMYDLLMRPFTKIVNEFSSFGYTFYDVNVKYNHVFSNKNRLFYSFYVGKDRSVIRIKMKEQYYKSIDTNDWGNLATSMRWNHVFNPKLFSNLTAYYTQYFYQLDEVYQLDSTLSGEAYRQKSSFRSGINDLGIKLDFHYDVFSKYALSFGLGSVAHRFVPSSTTVNIHSVFGKTNKEYGGGILNAFESYAYLENQFDITSGMNLNVGGRYSFYTVDQQTFRNFEPRIVLGLKLNQSSALKLGYTEMNQYVHLLSSSTTGIPADYWLPATSALKPSNARQIGFSFEHESIGGEYFWSIEPYYKEMSELVEFKQGYARLTNAKNWMNRIEASGTGKSYGVECYIEKKKGLYTGYLGYTLSHTNRQFNSLNNGKAFPYKYDRLHDVSLVVMRKLNDNLDLSATWVFGSGNAFTMAEGKYNIITNYNRLNIGDIYSDKNAYRLNPYHRLDLALNHRKKTAWGERTWSFSVYNAYNRKNPYFYFWDVVDTSTQELGLYQFSYFPIIPSISYSFKF